MSAVNGPGFYDIPEAEYHADTELAPKLGRSLSVSGAKKILALPARFAHERDHGQEPKDVFDLGTLAHRLILGAGGTVHVVDCYDWRLKKHQDEKRAKRAEGFTVVNRGDLLAASRMAAAVRRHPTAAAILSQGVAEKSLYWTDEATGVTLRARIDWLHPKAVVDVKTCADASPAGFASAVAKFGYDMQAAWYAEGVEALTGERLPFIFLCVEKEAPHFVAVYQLDDAALERGAYRNALARAAYAEHQSSGEWPAYSTEIETLSLPRWAS